MSDVPATVTTTAVEVIQPVAESSGSIWGYVVGGIALVVLAGYFGFKKINKPPFIIAQVRKRNRKEMKKHGIESTEVTVDLDKLLDSVEAYGIANKQSGTEVVKVLAPLNDNTRMKTAKDMYNSMMYIANSINDASLAREFKNKAKQVKGSSPLMAGLLKRAGI